MKNLFETPVLNVTKFDAEDVVTTSGLTGAEVAETTTINELAATKGVTISGSPIKITF